MTLLIFFYSVCNFLFLETTFTSSFLESISHEPSDITLTCKEIFKGFVAFNFAK